jgi:hypothetical protein
MRSGGTFIILALRRLDAEQQDLLLTHSAPAIMRTYPDNEESRDTCVEPGQLILWRWLSLDRFFPPSRDGDSNVRQRQRFLRGCASVSDDIANVSVSKALLIKNQDYQESCECPIIFLHCAHPDHRQPLSK